MPINKTVQIPKPRDWDELEVLVWDLFRMEWGDPLTVRHGRHGQRQNGVDIYGHPNQGSDLTGIQVKGKTEGFQGQLTEQEMQGEVSKARQFQPGLSRFILITSAPPDASVQQIARSLNAQSVAEGSVAIDVLGWEDLQERLASYPDLLKMYYPQLFAGSESELTAVFRELLQEQHREHEATLQRARPRFALENVGRSVDALHLIPEFIIHKGGGDDVSYIRWRFSGPLPPTDWRNLSASQFGRAKLRAEFGIDELVRRISDTDEPLDMAIEVSFYWGGEPYVERHTWPLYQASSWSVGDESLPPDFHQGEAW